MSDPITAFGNDMNDLVSSIQQYSPDQGIPSKIIKDSDNIGREINQFQSQIAILKNTDTSLEKKDKQLTESIHDILNTLIECKHDLDNLPKIDYSAENNPLNNNSNINHTKNKQNDTKSILSYALKLSKFSKIPRTFDGNLLPNNFTWPGDDNLRRGNLAIASMIPDKLVRFENFGPDYIEKEEKLEIHGNSNNTEKEAHDKIKNNGSENEEEEEDDFIPERNNSIDNINKNDSTTVMAGLDLLDSDDE